MSEVQDLESQVIAASSEDLPPPTQAEAEVEADELIAAQIDDLTIDNAIYVRGRPARIVSLDFPLVFWRFDDEDVVKHRSFNQSRALFQVSASVHASNVSAAAAAAASEASLGANGSGDRDRDELDDEDDWAAFENASSALPDNSARASAAAAAFSADLASLQRVHESEQQQQQHRAADAFDDGFGDDELEFAPVSAAPSTDAAASASGSAEQPQVVSPDPEYARAAGEFKNNFMNLLITSPKEFLLDRRACTLVVAGDRLKSLHLENCSNCVLRVDGKLKSLALVDCFNVCVHFDGAIASFSALRCERLRVAARGACSTFAVEASPQCAVAFAAAASPRVLITSSESPGFTLVAAAQAVADADAVAVAAAAPAVDIDIESGANASVAVESAPPAAADASAGAFAAPVGAQWPQTYEELVAADTAAESASIEGVSHQPTAGSGSVSTPNMQLCTLWNGQEFVTEVAKRESLGSYVQNFRTSE